jgi:hypothetical protein
MTDSVESKHFKDLGIDEMAEFQISEDTVDKANVIDI